MNNSWLLTVIVLVPFLVGLAVVYALVGFWLFGFISFIMNLVLVWYCLWPLSNQQLELEGFKSEEKETTEQSEVVIDEQGEVVSSKAQSHSAYRSSSENILAQANSNTFAVIFWFIVLCGFGALLYRMVALIAEDTRHEALAKLQPAAKLIQQVLDWVPARLLALAYVVAGDFLHGFNKWVQWLAKGLSASRDLLIAVGMSAMEVDVSDVSKADKEEVRNTIRMTDRALIVWLVVVAIFTLGALIY